MCWAMTRAVFPFRRKFGRDELCIAVGSFLEDKFARAAPTSESD
jgi:hypothetical protein